MEKPLMDHLSHLHGSPGKESTWNIHMKMLISKIVASLLCIAAFGLSSVPAHAVITAGSKSIGAVWFVGDSITQGNADRDSHGGMRADVYSNLAGASSTFTYTG